MKSLHIHATGGPDQFVLEDVEMPVPGPGQVRLDVKACALNHIDIDMVYGLSRFNLPFPFVPGIEIVGVVAEIGPGVEGVEVGQRVAPRVQRNCGRCGACRTARQSLCERLEWLSLSMPGGFAESILWWADQLVPVPDSIDDVSAAAIQVAFGTAWHMLFTRGRLRVGETVLINAVGSGIGSAAVQLAALAGARVLGTAGSDAKIERAKSFGLVDGVNYTTTPEFSDRVRELNGGRGVDLVFEHVGGSVFSQSLASMDKSGRLVTCGAHAQEVVPFDIIPFFRSEHEVIGSFAFVTSEVERVFQLAERGLITAVVDSVFSLANGADAMRRMESRDAFGKVVITP
jgi:NADPH:quinone reductase-like Zn-dependent oxidoreductase